MTLGRMILPPGRRRIGTSGSGFALSSRADRAGLRCGVQACSPAAPAPGRERWGAL